MTGDPSPKPCIIWLPQGPHCLRTHYWTTPEKRGSDAPAQCLWESFSMSFYPCEIPVLSRALRVTGESGRDRGCPLSSQS